MKQSFSVAVVGGGAAGFFAAIHVMDNFPNAQVTILEKSQKVLSKVKISGGGRCNVTNVDNKISSLVKAYPRGGRLLKKLFTEFKTSDTVNWFEKRNIPLVVQEDNCIFPKSQSSQTIIDCFLNECLRCNITILTSHTVQKINCIDHSFSLEIRDRNSMQFDYVIVTTGGSPKLDGLSWLAALGHEIISPVPSLFTFNMPSENISHLMGIVVENAITRIPGTNLTAKGPLLFTHWGMSGPAILVLSSFGARLLADKNYQFNCSINWVNQENHELVRKELSALVSKFSNHNLGNIRPYYLPVRLWHYLLDKIGIPRDRKWSELGKKGENKLLAVLTNDLYQVNGKTTFKEEFVTAGGVSLESVHWNSLESKTVPGLFFAGEVLDIDAITGGYNFQAAWTTAFIAAKLRSVSVDDHS
jgi:predicted Rossmann fold flavoprotein